MASPNQGNLPLSVQETSNFQTCPIQERGPENVECTLQLFDNSAPPWLFGSFVLRCMPKSEAGEITHSLANTNPSAHPKGFVNRELEGEQCFSWDVKFGKHLTVGVHMLDNDDKFTILFSSETKLTRSQILSQPQSRLPNACASVQFTIHSHYMMTTERRFRVEVEMDDVEKCSRDYNIMFIRKPQEPAARHRDMRRHSNHLIQL